VTLTLYSKPGCHLCEELRAAVDELQAEHPFTINEIDITTNLDLFARYRYEIPVLLKDGEEVARGRITDRELMALLRPEA
jgi:glutaredoxin